MITRTKHSSFLATSSRKFFKIGMGLSILLVIGAFKLPLYSKAPIINEHPFDGEEDIIYITQILPIKKELPPKEVKPKVKAPVVKPVPNVPVPDKEPVKEPIVEKATTSVKASTKQVLVPVEKKKKAPTPTLVEIMPSYEGGEAAMFAYIADNVYYSPQAIDIGIEGKVYVRFIIDKNGKVSNVEIAKGIDPLLDNAAIKVVKNMPTWEPGVQNGENVAVSMVLPINFVLR